MKIDVFWYDIIPSYKSRNVDFITINLYPSLNNTIDFEYLTVSPRGSSTVKLLKCSVHESPRTVNAEPKYKHITIFNAKEIIRSYECGHMILKMIRSGESISFISKRQSLIIYPVYNLSPWPALAHPLFLPKLTDFVKMGVTQIHKKDLTGNRLITVLRL